MMVVFIPRGIRLNNPANIRKSRIKWRGKIEPSADKDFEQFGSMEDGLRAAAKILRSYSKLYGIRTIRQIIARWAPTFENPTDAYVRFVAQRSGYSADAPLDFSDAECLGRVLTAIVEFEDAGLFVTPAEIAAAVGKVLQVNQ